MSQKLKYWGLFAILLVVTVTVTSIVEVSALKPGPGANRHDTYRYNKHLVCGDHLCSMEEKTKMVKGTK